VIIFAHYLHVNLDSFSMYIIYHFIFLFLFLTYLSQQTRLHVFLLYISDKNDGIYLHTCFLSLILSETLPAIEKTYPEEFVLCQLISVPRKNSVISREYQLNSWQKPKASFQIKMVFIQERAIHLKWLKTYLFTPSFYSLIFFCVGVGGFCFESQSNICDIDIHTDAQTRPWLDTGPYPEPRPLTVEQPNGYRKIQVRVLLWFHDSRLASRSYLLKPIHYGCILSKMICICRKKVTWFNRSQLFLFLLN
jgi:hypothetical protein